MWTHTIAPFLFILAISTFIFSVPVCLGMLLRLLFRKMKPSFVAWVGAALGLTAQYGAANHNTIMMNLPFVGNALLPARSLSAIGLLIFLAMWFVFIKCGVELIDRQTKQQSGRFWLIACPVIAVTVYGDLVFGLMSFYQSMGKFSYLFAVLYRFFLWELLFILCVTFMITMLYVNRRKKRSPTIKFKILTLIRQILICNVDRKNKKRDR
jgi:hypothetical protein